MQLMVSDIDNHCCAFAANDMLRNEPVDIPAAKHIKVRYSSPRYKPIVRLIVRLAVIIDRDLFMLQYRGAQR